MAGPDLGNETPYAAAHFFAADAEGRDVAVCLVQATWEIAGPHELLPAEAHGPVSLAGEWHGKPGRSSPRLEAQIAVRKEGTDLVLLGKAYPARAGDACVEVGLRVGSTSKVVRVFGDRVWLKSFGEIASAPAPFESVPLIYERAYGGSGPGPESPRERRNPVGRGFRVGPFLEGSPLPNLEDPRHLIRSSWDRPPPAGFGFLSPDWLPRAALCGTFDKAWMEGRMPLLPVDFNPRFYQAAHPDLATRVPLQGNERVTVVGASRLGRLDFGLPGLLPPRLESDAGGPARTEEARLDTVVVDAEAGMVHLLWRAARALPKGLAGLRKLRVLPGAPPAGAGTPAPAPAGGRRAAAWA